MKKSKIQKFKPKYTYYSYFNDADYFLFRKRLIQIWDLIHKTSNLDLTPEPLKNYEYNKFFLPFEGITKLKYSSIEYMGEMLGYSFGKGKWEKSFDYAHGKGINYYSDDFIFNGYWKYGFAHGKGIFLNRHCDFFIGIWKNGKFKKLIDEYKWEPKLLFKHDKKFKKDQNYLKGKLLNVKKSKSQIFGNFGKNQEYENLDFNKNYYLSRGGETDGISDPQQSVKQLMEMHYDNEIHFFNEWYKDAKKEGIINLNTKKNKLPVPYEHNK